MKQTLIQKFLGIIPEDAEIENGYKRVYRDPKPGDFILIIKPDGADEYETGDILQIKFLDYPGVHCATKTHDAFYIASYEFVVVEKVEEE